MAIRPIKVSRRIVEEPEEEEEIIEGDEEEEEVVPTPRKKVVAPAPVVRRQARQIVEEEEEEVAPRKIVPPQAKKIVVPVAPTKKVAPPAEEEEEEIKPVRVKSVEATVIDSLFPQLLQSLEAGKSLIISAVGNNKWQISTSEAVVSSGKKLSGPEYAQTVFSQEYLDWNDEWRQLTYAEKLEKAAKAKVQWDKHENPKVDVMRLTEAYREHIGVEKYKPEYASRKAREVLRG